MDNNIPKGSKRGDFPEENINDLFMAAKTQKVWVNLWRAHGDSERFVAIACENEAQRDSDLKTPMGLYFLKTIETEVEL